jgi:hypothetical protein
MLSYLDCIIFPDRCEVIEVVPSQRYVYPIFKNASSSLHYQAIQSSWRIIFNEQIKKLSHIEVILRDPQQRLVSGFNTFIQHVLQDNPELDQTTVVWFAKNYLFLDRHYCPQFFWLINLARYLSPDTVLTFRHMDRVADITSLHRVPEGITPSTEDLAQQALSIPNIEMYQRLDQMLFAHVMDRDMTFDQVLHTLQQQDPTAYDWVVGRSQRILNSTYVLPQA